MMKSTISGMNEGDLKFDREYELPVGQDPVSFPIQLISYSTRVLILLF